MIGALASLALGIGVPKGLSRFAAWAALVVATGLAVWGIYALIYSNGEKAGGAKVTAKVEKAHKERVAESRSDERAAQVASDSISRRVSRADDLSTIAVQTTIKDLRNALDAQAAAPAGAVPAPAPVGSMSASLNVLVDRANRAAEAADAAQ